MSFVTKFENNSMRKSYRTTIPLQVIVEGHTYSAIDWSLTGLALPELQTKLPVGKHIDATLVLSLHEAVISLPVKLLHEYTENGRSGFSFVDLSEKNRSVLRRFIEMAIEGSIDRVDDIIAIYEEPKIETPIQTPVTLQDEEVRTLTTSFRRTAGKYLLFALFVFTVVGILFFYNLRYSYKGSGIVAGNDVKIYTSVNALVDKIYVHEGDQVQKGKPLVDLNDETIAYKLALLEVEKNRKIKLFNAEKEKTAAELAKRKDMIALLTQKVAKKRVYYNNLKKDFNARLITKKALTEAENAYMEAKLQLQKLKMQSSDQSESSAKNFALEIEDIDVKIDYLKKQLTLYRIVAPVDAKVYEVYVTEGQEATKNNPLMLLWTKDTPYIEATVPTKYLSDITTGTKVDIVDSYQNRLFEGEVYKTGNLHEKLQSDVFTVYVKPKDLSYSLKPHQRVQLLFKRDF